MSGSTGGYVGVGIIALLDTYGPGFPHLHTFIILRNCCSLLPLALIPLLCPAGSPRSTMANMQKAADNSAADAHADAHANTVSDVDTSVISRSSVELTPMGGRTAVQGAER